VTQRERFSVIRDTISKLVHGASWLGVVLVGLATAWWVAILADRPGGGVDGWAALGFTLVAAIPLGGGILLLGVIPSGVLCLQGSQRRDRLSLWLAGGSFLVILGEGLFLLYISPP
jgi:hypothetical protein